MDSKADKIYKKIIQAEQSLKIRKEELKELEIDVEMLRHEYRVESVCRVLEWVRNEYINGRAVNLDLYLCHCQNKLHGNLDGTELNLEKGEKE